MNRVIVITTSLIMLCIGEVRAQVPLSQIEGFLELYLPGDTTSLYLGWKSGQEIDDVGSYDNVFIGNSAGRNTTNGDDNVFIGSNAGRSNTTGDVNLFVGHQSGSNNVSGFANSFYGARSGINNIDGNWNTFIGAESGTSNISGSDNVFLGTRSGNRNTTGDDQIFIGRDAGAISRDGGFSVVIGNGAADFDSGIESSVYIGHEAGKLMSSTSRRGNVFIGSFAGFNHSGSNRLFIANNPGGQDRALIYGEFDNELLQVNGTMKVHKDNPSGPTITGVLEAPISNRPVLLFSEGGSTLGSGMSIEYDGTGSGSGNYMTINRTGGNPMVTFRNDGNVGIGTITPTAELEVVGDAIFNNNLEVSQGLFLFNLPSGGSTDLRINGSGQVSQSSSDIRLKHDIVTVDDALSKVLEMRGVTFKWNDEPEAGAQLGVIAQEVQSVVPELVTDNGEYLGVDYSEMAALFIEAFKEQQAVITKLESTVIELQKRLQFIESSSNTASTSQSIDK